MKNIKTIISGALLASVFATGIIGSSCSKWTEPEALDFFEPVSAEYKAQLKQYLQSKDHRVMYGWFGNWSGKGGSMEGRLTGLPDSTDFVSLWGGDGNFNEAQIADLREFQERGARAILCFRAGDVGERLTPAGEVPARFWLAQAEEKGLENYSYEGDFPDETNMSKAQLRAAAYAMAIVDTVRKYGVDGFDYDIEDWGTLMDRTNTAPANTFMKVLRHEFNKDGRMLVADIPGGTSWLTFYDVLEDEVVLSLDYLAWQTYDLVGSGLDNFFEAVKSHKPAVFENVMKKSIVTATFEEAAKKFRFGEQAHWVPECGIDFGGCGAYHIEYDYAGNPDYPEVRKAISVLNPPAKVKPTEE